MWSTLRDYQAVTAAAASHMESVIEDVPLLNCGCHLHCLWSWYWPQQSSSINHVTWQSVHYNLHRCPKKKHLSPSRTTSRRAAKCRRGTWSQFTEDDTVQQIIDLPLSQNDTARRYTYSVTASSLHNSTMLMHCCTVHQSETSTGCSYDLELVRFLALLRIFELP